MSNLEISAAEPTAEEYVRLRRAAGLDERSIEAARIALPNSFFSVCIRNEAELIGMGRIVGDGGCNFEIVDVAVHPDYQRRGLGSQIMAGLMAHLRSTAPPSAYVSLIADGGTPALYEKFGFEPTAPASIGMALVT